MTRRPYVAAKVDVCEAESHATPSKGDKEPPKSAVDEDCGKDAKRCWPLYMGVCIQRRIKLCPSRLQHVLANSGMQNTIPAASSDSMKMKGDHFLQRGSSQAASQPTPLGLKYTPCCPRKRRA